MKGRMDSPEPPGFLWGWERPKEMGPFSVRVQCLDLIHHVNVALLMHDHVLSMFLFLGADGDIAHLDRKLDELGLTLRGSEGENCLKCTN